MLSASITYFELMPITKASGPPKARNTMIATQSIASKESFVTIRMVNAVVAKPQIATTITAKAPVGAVAQTLRAVAVATPAIVRKPQTFM
jgi:hypothetical protein